MRTSRNSKRRRPEPETYRPSGAPVRRRAVPRYMQEKLAVTVLVIMLALFALSVVLYRIVDQNNDDYTRVVLSQHSTYDSRTIPYRRGDIVDRNGTYLATSERVYNLILDPYQIYSKEENYLQTTVDALVQCFGFDKTELLNTLSERRNDRYVRYARRLSYEKKEEFEALETQINNANREQDNPGRVYGIWFEDEYQRFYPYGSLACNVIGFANSDGAGGNGGIEQYYNSQLIGVNGREYGYLNGDSNMETVIKPASNGNTIVSTIDANVQSMVEKRVEQWMTETGSSQIGVVVMDPRNGEILAMATDKTYDLNDPRDLTGLYTEAEIEAMDEEEQSNAWNQLWRNFCVSDTFEPGSPSKVFTVAAALEENLVNANTHFFCDGYQVIAGRPVKCTAYSKGGHGDLALGETLVVSCNDAMMQIAAMEGKTVFKKYQDLFNLGASTGIDLPGEADAATLVYREDNMGPMDLATNSFGQNYNCTMVQMAAAFASVINGGSYYEPHVMRQILNEDGAVIEKNDGVLVRETVSESTSSLIRDALVRTVAEGTGKAAQVEGYEIGGKTGTAEKIPRNQGNYLVSFCGFAPGDDPQVLVYVVIDEPNVEDQAHSSYASGVFSQIMGDILPYLNVFPIQELPEGEGQTEEQMAGEGLHQGEEPEEETQEEPQIPYETDEYVPQETAEDGSLISSGIPAELPGSPDTDEPALVLPEMTAEETSAPETDGEPASSAEETSAPEAPQT